MATSRWATLVVPMVLFATSSLVACSAEPVAGGEAARSEAALPPPDLQQQLVDARLLAAALEAYAVDNAEYPMADGLADLERSLIPRYMGGFPKTPFQVVSAHEGYTISSMTGYKLLSGSIR